MNKIHQEQIAKDFDLGAVFSVVEDTEGALNKNYFFETEKGKFFIKSVREKRKEYLKNIAAIESLMAQRGIPAVCMRKTQTGALYTSIDNNLYTVYPFIKSDRSHKYTATDIFAMGVLLGKIHQAGSHDIPEFLQEKKLIPKKKAPIIEKLESYKSSILQKQKIEAMDEKFLSCINLKLSVAETIQEIEHCESNTLVHGDYHERNLLIDSNTREILGVCDWEKAEMMPRGYELARSLMIIVFNQFTDLAVALPLAKKFIEGYVSVYPMTQEEFISGCTLRVYSTVLSQWLEEIHYIKKDFRSDFLVQKEVDLINLFIKGNLLDKIVVNCF